MPDKANEPERDINKPDPEAQRTSADQVEPTSEEIRELLATLDEEAKRYLAAELARDVQDDARKVAVEAVRTASGEAQQEIVAEAVSAAPLETKMTAAVKAVETAADAGQIDVVAQAVRSASTVEAKKVAAAEAVNSTSAVNKAKVAAEAVEQLSPKQQEEMINQLPISQVTDDYIWRTVVGAFKWILWGATAALIGAIGVSIFREVDQAYIQILLTVFTTVAGIFAGFISGKAMGHTEDGIWLRVVDAFKWVLWGATVALIAAIGVALFRQVDQVLIQILLTVFTTVVGIFAGIITGRALVSSDALSSSAPSYAQEGGESKVDEDHLRRLHSGAERVRSEVKTSRSSSVIAGLGALAGLVLGGVYSSFAGLAAGAFGAIIAAASLVRAEQKEKQVTQLEERARQLEAREQTPQLEVQSAVDKLTENVATAYQEALKQAQQEAQHEAQRTTAESRE